MRERLSTNFYRDEFACNGRNCCGGSAPISDLLVEVLQVARTRIARPLTINSGFRCLTHNRSIKSNDASQHPRGTAADVALVRGLTIDGMAAVFHDALCEVMDYPDWQDCGGIGLYDTFIHVDVRQNTVARWDKRT